MFITCALRGLGRALANPRLALLLWLVNAALAAIAAVPAFLHLSSLLATRPAGDRLLHGFSFGLMAEMGHYQGAWGSILMSVLWPLAVVALLGNTLTSGGVLEVLTTRDERRLLHRFGRGAGHFFGRFFRAGLVAGLVGLVVAGMLAVLVRWIGRRLEDSAWEPTGLVVALVRFALVGLVVLLVLMALDLARVRIVLEDSRQAIRLFFRSLAFVLRHPVKVLGLWAVNSLVLLGVLAAYLAYCNRFPATRWRLILAMVAVQQAVMLARAGLRVGLWASEIALWERMAPAATPVAPEPRIEPVTPEPAGPGEGSILGEAFAPEAPLVPAPAEGAVPMQTPAATPAAAVPPAGDPSSAEASAGTPVPEETPTPEPPPRDPPSRD